MEAYSIEASEAEVNELVSHVMALRKDFIQNLLAEAQVASSERNQRKADLRAVLHRAIDDGRLSIERVVQFLDEHEPGGKQHVFLWRPPKAFNDSWKDTAAVKRRMRSHQDTKDLLGAAIPLVMPEELELSAVHVDEQMIEVLAVEARRYFERDDQYDSQTTSNDGLPVELRAYVERVARSTVLLRWDVGRRHAAMHITQATSRGVPRHFYTETVTRFSDVVSSWLDMSQFKSVDLHKVIHGLQEREQKQGQALTRSRRGRWETDDGSEVEAISASTDESLFKDRRVAAAVKQVSDEDSGSSGNLYWLNTATNPLTEPLHLVIIASDSRLNFMQPSSPEVVKYVITRLRRFL
jgi:hypothetical protein